MRSESTASPDAPGGASHPRLARRACGALLHLTSLPGPHGCGDLGPAARRFADFLASAGQAWWQMLPIHPPGPGGSPYDCDSAFAGSPWLISLEGLRRDGLLTRSELADDPAAAGRRRADRVDFAATGRYRDALLRRAAERFFARPRRARAAFENFCRRRRSAWLDDYALFRALRAAHGGAAWTLWPGELRSRRPDALRRAARALRRECDHQRFAQFAFERQWRAMKSYATSRGVLLMGDVPFFVSHDCADVWARQALFDLAPDGRPRRVSGCPPDYFSRSGQLWGHPLYRWRAHAATRFAWWIARLRSALERFDAVRIDHFLGFHRVWAVPAGAATARRGRWLRTPGRALLAAARRALGTLPIVAEDLGAVTPQAFALRDEFGLPGMRVLQFAFGAGGEYHLPHNHPRRSVVYVGTHDNDTAAGWFQGLPRGGGRGGVGDYWNLRDRVLCHLGCDARQVHWGLIRAAFASPADLAIVAVQDWLGLPGAARMNTPATRVGNWSWRLKPGALTPELARRLRRLALTFERCGRLDRHASSRGGRPA